MHVRRKPDADKHTAGPDVSVSVEFLQQLRLGGPWTLTAIDPNTEDITTDTVRTTQEVEAFIRKYDGKRNIYYAVNPLRKATNKKAAKTDVAMIEYALADLDPDKNESPEAAKKRYLDQLNSGVFLPRPGAVVDSGNGLQCIWRFEDSIALAAPQMVTVTGKDGEKTCKLVFPPEAQEKIDDVEERIKVIMLRLGAKPGTQNIDRILRLPGTTNLPNATKRARGRVPCPTKVLWHLDVAFPLAAFPKPTSDGSATGNKQASTKGAPQSSAEGGEEGDDDLLARAIHDADFSDDRSNAVWYVVCEMLKRGYAGAAIVRVLLDRNNAVSAHTYDQAKPEAYAERQIEQAIEKIGFIYAKGDTKKIKKLPIAANIHIAMFKLGVSVRYDRFGDRIMLDGLKGFGPTLDDAAVNRLWLTFGRRFRFRPALELTRIVVSDVAHLNGFHPVHDYLDALQWDGKARIDRWLSSYAGAEDNAYTRAVGALQLIAAVRRIRQPGCKFDEMLVLEQPLQGTDKSTALSVLAVNDEWFTDDLPLNADSRKTIESLRGRWIVEVAELSGMRKAEIEHVKSLLSRRIDRARPAYGRLAIEVPRQNIMFGTTNRGQYLRDTTGNRRFWPVAIEQFDLAALRRDRDQLWAEAAAREAKGESIRLRHELWPVAAQQQQQRLADDPFVAILHAYLGDLEGKIKAVDVWTILDLRGAQLTQDAYMRASEAMKRIGWKRPNKSGSLRFDGKPEVAFVRGNPPHWKINVERNPFGLSVVSEKEIASAKKKGSP